MALALKLYQERALGRLQAFLEACRLEAHSQAFATTVDVGLRTEYRPMPGLPGVPYVCLRIPTGGGKTVMGAHIIRLTGTAYLEREFPLVLWLVPTTQIKTQTLEAFRDPRHPYRIELDTAFGGQVAIFDIAEFTQIRPADLGTKACLVVATTAALRVENKDGRRVYEHNEALEPHFAGSIKHLEYLDRRENGEAAASFCNLLRLHGPLVIMDEAHNATTELSYTVYERLGPKAVVELTATPDTSSSNVLVSVSAFELKQENMIKFPVVLQEHLGEWQAAVSAAVARRKTLAGLALKEPDYIRPILLIQAENAKGVATVEMIKAHLLETDGLDPKAVAIATGESREIDGVNLFARDCPIEVIITMQALKEGWDCSFAYVFCSVAQVKSDTDIQQLLGRVLRLPYATPRSQIQMSKAYAHVVTESFAAAAGEITRSLQAIGFDPFEAAAAIKREPPQPGLGLAGGGAVPVTAPVVVLALPKPPDLTGVPASDMGRVRWIPALTGEGGQLELTDEVDPLTVEAVLQVVPRKERAALAEQIALHQQHVITVKAPCTKGAVFSIPRLCAVDQGELELVDRGAVAANFSWDLLSSPADFSSLHFDEATMTFEVDLGDNQRVQYRQVKNDVATYLPGFAADRTEVDLIGWLDHEVREPSVRQPVLREWIRRAIDGLLRDRGFSLAQLLKGQFVLRRKLQEQLTLAKERAYRSGFQQFLALGDDTIVVSTEPGHAFVYPADVSAYPGRVYYQNDAYRFTKHYYPLVADLTERTQAGALSEEFLCAQAIDLLDEVEFWVRNLAHPSQFWMPTASDRTYPDFVARLKDGRLLVVEYKGGDRITNVDSKEKRMVGELWARKSGGRGVYLMAQKTDELGRAVREQLLAAIRGK